jgi:hypothetical protein
VDTICYRLPNFIKKARRAGVVRVFVGLESINPDSLLASKKKQNKITEYRKMLLEWKHAGVHVFAGYILGFPADTPESILRDIKIIQRELPVDLVQFSCMTPLPGSEDHQKLYNAGVEMDPDLNKYDVEHVTTSHSSMSTKQWEQVYQDAWAAYYTPEHLETVMRREMATGGSPGKVLTLLMWSYASVALEGMHPYQGGYLRRKYRKDRRPHLPVESPFSFYPRYLANLVVKHVKLGRAVWRYYHFVQGLKADPNARNYTDLALTPVTDEDYDSFEMFAASDAAKSEVGKLRKPSDGRAAVSKTLVRINQ